MPTLDEIQAKFDEIVAEFDRDDLSPEEMVELEARLDAVYENKQDKADAYARLILENSRRKKSISEEAKRLAARAKAAEGKETFLKAKFQANLESLGIKKFEGHVYTLSLRASTYCDVVDKSLIPDKWWNVKTTREPALSDILFALKQGEEIPGCRLGKRNSLQVK